MRDKIVKCSDADIFCVTETHLRGEDKLNVNGYRYYGINRVTDNNKGSGGVGMLIKLEMFSRYNIKQRLIIRDNVVGVELQPKDSGESIAVYCIYLPPISSPYASENESILDSLIIECYDLCDIDNVFFCGDFNTRVGNKKETQMCDELPNHVVIDEVFNQQGDKLLNFTNDIKGCIINGRITPNMDDFTSVTGYKGKAVVDYHITRQSDISGVVKMSVESCNNLIRDNKLTNLLNERSHVPDHSLLSMWVELSTCVKESLVGNTLGSKSVSRRKTYRKTGDNYMNSSTTLRVLPELLERMQKIEANQAEVNHVYGSLIELIEYEAENSLRTKNRKRKETKFKDYWDKELSTLWRLMHESERIFRMVVKKKNGNSNNNSYHEAKIKFKKAQKLFDKKLKEKKKQYCEGLLVKIDTCLTNDPSAF